DDGGADRDRHVHVAGEVDVPHGAAVDAAPHGFEPVDDPHGGGFRRPGEGAGRERRPGRVVGLDALTEVPGDGGDDVLDVGEALQVHEVPHHHGAGGAELLQIVAGEVDQHQVLGALLRVGEQLCAERLVLLRGGPAG